MTSLNKIALAVQKKIYAESDGFVIVYPFYLEDPKDSQRYKSLKGQRTTFIDFHHYMFSLDDMSVQKMMKNYKIYYASESLSEDESAYLDVLLFKDALDYQRAIRSSETFDYKVADDIAKSFLKLVKRAESFDEITSEVLIEFAEKIRTFKAQITGSQLKAARLAKGLDQQEFGVKVLGLAPSSARSHVSRMETGKTTIPNKYTDILGISLEAGSKWVAGSDENGNKIIVHLHEPKFSAKVKKDTVINPGFSATVPATGEVLCDFIFYDLKPESEELNELVREAVQILACKRG